MRTTLYWLGVLNIVIGTVIFTVPHVSLAMDIAGGAGFCLIGASCLLIYLGCPSPTT